MRRVAQPSVPPHDFRSPRQATSFMAQPSSPANDPPALSRKRVIVLFADRLERDLWEQAVRQQGAAAASFSNFRDWASASSAERPHAVIADGRLLSQTSSQAYVPGLVAAGVKIIAIGDSTASAPGVTTVKRSLGLAPILAAIASRPLPSVHEPLTEYRARLTDRELDIARYVASGLSNQAIAERTGLRIQTIKNSVSAVMKKLGCRNRVQVALRLVLDGDGG